MEVQFDFRAILDASDQNLFFVDWSIGAKSFIYGKARGRVNEVGKIVAQFINFLGDNSGLKVENLTLIGFSLGGKNEIKNDLLIEKLLKCFQLTS